MTERTTGPMAGKTVLVTGGTRGIGRATAEGLSALGARVGITGRDQEQVEVAAAEIASKTGSAQVNAFAADMSSLAEVRSLAGAVLEEYPRLDVLVNNAGTFCNTRHVTVDGFERTFAVNHLAPFLLTSLLLDRLKASAPARIVTVSSNGHAMGKFRFDDLQGEKRYSGRLAYAQSKLANIAFTYELARRLDGTEVTATVLHPGLVRTRLGTEDPSALLNFAIFLASPTAKTAEQGAATSIYLASAPEAEGVTGRYFVDCRPKSSSKVSYDTVAGTRLWEVSADLVGL
jgi:retinol dehydrogenase 14